MPVQVEQLGRAFSAETEHQFTVWTLATPDPLEQVLEPGYFGRCYSRFRLSDLVVCATRQPPGKPQVPRDAHPDRHRCLLMVTGLVPGGVEVRGGAGLGLAGRRARARRDPAKHPPGDGSALPIGWAWCGDEPQRAASGAERPDDRPAARDPPPARGGDADRGAARRSGGGDLGEAAGAARYACGGDGPGDPGRAGRGAAGSWRHGGTGSAGRADHSGALAAGAGGGGHARLGTAVQGHADRANGQEPGPAGAAAMSRTRGTMQEIANPGSEFTWATYVFAGNDLLEAALAPGYFAQWASRLQPGDLILWGCNPDRTGRSNLGEPVDIPARAADGDHGASRPVRGQAAAGLGWPGGGTDPRNRGRPHREPRAGGHQGGRGTARPIAGPGERSDAGLRKRWGQPSVGPVEAACRHPA